MTGPDPSGTGRPVVGERILTWLLLLWIGVTGPFFFIRFSFAFYYANEGAIRSALGW